MCAKTHIEEIPDILRINNPEDVSVWKNITTMQKPRQPSYRLTGGVSLTSEPNNRIVGGNYLLHTWNTKGYTFRYRFNVAIVSFIACA